MSFFVHREYVNWNVNQSSLYKTAKNQHTKMYIIYKMTRKRKTDIAFSVERDYTELINWKRYRESYRKGYQKNAETGR